MMLPRIRPLDQEESAVFMALESRYTDGNSFTFEEAELVRWLIGESYIVEPGAEDKLSLILHPDTAEEWGQALVDAAAAARRDEGVVRAERGAREP